MALEGTHIRIALDVKSELGIKEFEKYIAGAIYPDSRYVTGIERTATHNLDFFAGGNYKNDFQKGWHTHLLCDKIQHAMMHELLPDILQCEKEDHDWWATITAIKTAQDTSDLNHFDIGQFLYCLKYAENPNGEDIEKVRAYNDAVASLYKGKIAPSLKDYHSKLLSFGIADELAKDVIEKTKKFPENEDIRGRIYGIYDKMLPILKKVLISKPR